MHPLLVPLLLIFIFVSQSCNDTSAREEKDSSILLNGKGFAIVELFTSEGCSSCPPADDLINKIQEEAIKNNKEVFVLSEHVDYWNRLGWTDAYSKKFFSDRQRWYAGFLKDDGIYTPQVVVNGSISFVGSDEATATKSINAFLTSTQPDSSIKLSTKDFSGGNIEYAVSKIKEGEVLNLALVERNVVSDVSRGENKGRTLHHCNVVRDWVTVEHPSATGRAQFNIGALQPDRNKFQVIAFVQDKNNGAISDATVLR